MWSLNGFINDLPLPCRRVKNSFVKYSESDLYMVWKCFNINLMLTATLSYSKFESIQLQREESAEKSNESRNMLFIL